MQGSCLASGGHHPVPSIYQWGEGKVLWNCKSNRLKRFELTLSPGVWKSIILHRRRTWAEWTLLYSLENSIHLVFIECTVNTQCSGPGAGEARETRMGENIPIYEMFLILRSFQYWQRDKTHLGNNEKIWDTVSSIKNQIWMQRSVKIRPHLGIQVGCRLSRGNLTGPGREEDSTLGQDRERTKRWYWQRSRGSVNWHQNQTLILTTSSDPLKNMFFGNILNSFLNWANLFVLSQFQLYWLSKHSLRKIKYRACL